jgi:hypothetical protein
MHFYAFRLLASFFVLAIKLLVTAKPQLMPSLPYCLPAISQRNIDGMEMPAHGEKTALVPSPLQTSLALSVATQFGFVGGSNVPYPRDSETGSDVDRRRHSTTIARP